VIASNNVIGATWTMMTINANNINHCGDIHGNTDDADHDNINQQP
jgi:hypothetical protein